MKKYLFRVLALTMACALLLSGCAGGKTEAPEDWATTTVSVVVPYSPGGDTDTYCRALFDRVGKSLGITFVITNQTGGSGMVASMNVMSQKPDGYTLLFCHTGAALVQEATGMVEFSYTHDFTNVCTVAIDETYALVAVDPNGQYGQYSRGWSDLEGMIEDAKANPGKIRYSTVFGSTTQYVGQMLERDAGISFDNLDVGSDAASRMTALLGGQVDLMAANYMNVRDYIENGDLVCLGIMAKERVEGIDFPTFVEQGCPSVVTAKKYEIKFPKGVDQVIVDKLAAACKEVTEDQEFIDLLATYYAQPLYRDAETMNTEDPAEVEMLEAGLAFD